MEQGCRAALAVLKGCSEADVQLHRQPADEEWMRTAAITFAISMGRDDELLYLRVNRFVEARRVVQRLPCGDAEYDNMVNSLEAFLTSMRQRHGEEAVALALLTADIRESRELLPDGFRITVPEGGLRVTEGYPSSETTCTLHIPGMTGTLHNAAVYDVQLGVRKNYPMPPPVAAQHDINLGLFHAKYLQHPGGSAKKPLYHPNVYPSGKLCWHGMLDIRGCWDASCSLTEVALHVFACLHHMYVRDPAQKEPYLSATKDRPAFRRHVREGALRAKADPPPPPTPEALQRAVLLPDPSAAHFPAIPNPSIYMRRTSNAFRSFDLGGRTLRLNWPVEGKWPTFTWPDDVSRSNVEGKLVDPEPPHIGWL